jgi:hypothetical protein
MFTVAGTGGGDDSGNSRRWEAEEEADPEASPAGGDIAGSRLLFLVVGRRRTAAMAPLVGAWRRR